MILFRKNVVSTLLHEIFLIGSRIRYIYEIISSRNSIKLEFVRFINITPTRPFLSTRNKIRLTRRMQKINRRFINARSSFSFNFPSERELASLSCTKCKEESGIEAHVSRFSRRRDARELSSREIQPRCFDLPRDRQELGRAVPDRQISRVFQRDESAHAALADGMRARRVSASLALRDVWYGYTRVLARIHTSRT